MDEYRVETVEAFPPASHHDYACRSVLVRITRLLDQQAFRLKIRQSLGLRVGEVVRLSPGTVRSSQIDG